MKIMELVGHLEQVKRIYGDIDVQVFNNFSEAARRDPDPIATFEDKDPHYDVRNGVLVL